MKRPVAAIVSIVCVVLLLIAIPASLAFNNWYDGVLQKIDDNTSYKTRKEVEDTCRAMMANYEADRLTYEQYKDSEKSSEQGYAASAKMRANNTASQYNNYILKNSYVWKDNVPDDIRQTLDYLE